MQRVSKWGNSLALRLPQALAEQIDIQDGSEIKMHVSGDSIVISRARPTYRLDDLLDRYKPEHRHDEVDWGKPVGSEVW